MSDYHQTPCNRCGRPVDSAEPIDNGFDYYCAPCVAVHPEIVDGDLLAKEET